MSLHNVYRVFFGKYSLTHSILLRIKVYTSREPPRWLSCRVFALHAEYRVSISCRETSKSLKHLVESAQLLFDPQQVWVSWFLGDYLINRWPVSQKVWHFKTLTAQVAVTWLKYCQNGVKLYPINQSYCSVTMSADNRSEFWALHLVKVLLTPFPNAFSINCHYSAYFIIDCKLFSKELKMCKLWHDKGLNLHRILLKPESLATYYRPTCDDLFQRMIQF